MPTVEVPSLERTSPRSIGLQLTLLAGSVGFFSMCSFDHKSDIHSIISQVTSCCRSCNAVHLYMLSYAIGVAEPLSIYVDTYGTGKKTDEELVAIIRNNWDLRPGVIGK